MRVRLAGMVLAVGGLLTAGMPAYAADVPDAPGVLATNEHEAALLRDAAHIATTTGLPLALVQSEVLIQDEVGKLQEQAMRTWPETFGGLWIEQRTGEVHVAFTRDTAASVATLAATFTRPALLKPVTVERSYAELKALQERMMADRTAFAAGRGVTWPGLVGTRYALDVDVRENRPVVVTDGHTAATVAALRAAYGDLRVDDTGNGAPHACTKEDCRFYLRSGLGIGGGGTPNCSTAFAVASGWSGDEIMTAGHCRDGSIGYHGGYAWGPSQRAYQNSGNVDAIAYTVTSSNFKAGSWIFVNTSETTRRVTGMQSYSSLAVGQWICKSGATTGYTCGSVLSRDYSDPGDWRTPAHHNFILTDMCDKPGDSGAGIYIGGTAVGIISAGNNDTCAAPYRGWHGHIDNATRALGLIVLTSTPAPFLNGVTSASGSTIQVKFGRLVKCSSVNTSDFKVRLQNQVDYTVSSVSCTADAQHTVTLTTSLPLVKASTVYVHVNGFSIWDPYGQYVPANYRTATVA